MYVIDELKFGEYIQAASHYRSILLNFLFPSKAP